MRTVDLFCGCGGFTQGFVNAGYQVVAAYDNWELALTSYSHNFRHDAHKLDLACSAHAAEHISQYNPEVIIGGPPCQDFSIAGKRVEAGRANLTTCFAETVVRVAPEIFVMENVYSIEKSEALKRSRAIFKRAGYGLTSRIIDASRVGVPQMRKRFFLIGGLNLQDGAFAAALDGGLSAARMTVADFFGPSLDLQYYYAHPRSYQRRAVFSVDEPSATIRRVNRPIPPTYQSHPADKAAITPDVRPLTTEERAQIQTFPKAYRFVGTRSQREHQIANAVPVKLAQYVAECILKAL